MRRRGENSRPPIPEWVVDIRHWQSVPHLSAQKRAQRWGAERQEWLDAYGYDVFDESDATVAYRMREAAGS